MNGHSSVYATENYVRLTIQLFPDIVTKNGDAVQIEIADGVRLVALHALA